MSRHSVRLTAFVLFAVVGLALSSLPLWAGPAAHPVKSSKTELHRTASANLASALTAMDEASKALSAGEKDKASAALEKARKLVQDTQDSFLKHAPGVKK